MPPLDLGLSETTFADLDHGMELLFGGLETGFDHGMDAVAEVTAKITEGLPSLSKGIAKDLFNLAAPDVTAPKIGFVPTPVVHNAYTA